MPKIDIDTAPTGHTLRLLTLPEILGAWLEHLLEKRAKAVELMSMVARYDRDVRRKIETDRKFFPGYVLVKCEMTDEVYHLIKNTPKDTGFLGADKAKPMPIPEHEAMRIKGQVAEGIERPKPTIVFEVGEQVKVADGPFASFNGVVEEVDHGRARLKVAVSIFGRATPVELEYGQVEKL